MLSHVAVGTWSGGRFMRFGEPISDERLAEAHEAPAAPGADCDMREHALTLRCRSWTLDP